MESVRSYSPTGISLPRVLGGPAPASAVSGPAPCLLHITACRLAKSPKATLYIRGFSGFVTSTPTPIATARSDPVPGRAFHPAVAQRLFTAHQQALARPLFWRRRTASRDQSLSVFHGHGIHDSALNLLTDGPVNNCGWLLGQFEQSVPSRHWFEISKPNFPGNDLRTNSRFGTAIKMPSTVPNPRKCSQTDSADRSGHPS